MRTDKCLDANTGLSQQSLRSSLRQEIVRRMLNTDLETPISEVVVILDNFYVKMAKSGHQHDQAVHGAVRLPWYPSGGPIQARPLQILRSFHKQLINLGISITDA